MKAGLLRLPALCIAAVILLTFGSASADGLDVSAKGAILIESRTGKVLYAKNAHEKLPMASTTKIMTALLAIENGNLNDIVETDASAYGTEGSSIYLDYEEKISLKDLLYGLMLSSGNDAAVAIAVHIGKGTNKFAEMMNARAKSIGALNTNFVTPNGLHDENHYTTAYDLARITAVAMKSPVFREIVSTQYYRAETGAKPRTFKNKNKILWEYDGGSGVKTGYTKIAGKCLVFSAERNGMEVIGVVLNCPGMFDDAKAMMNYAFENYETATMVKAGNTIAGVDVAGGEKNILELKAGEDIIVPVRKGESASYRTRVILKEGLHTPIAEGTELGCVEVLDDGALLCTCPLLSAKDMPGVGIRFYFDKLMRCFTA